MLYNERRRRDGSRSQTAESTTSHAARKSKLMTLAGWLLLAVLLLPVAGFTAEEPAEEVVIESAVVLAPVPADELSAFQAGTGGSTGEWDPQTLSIKDLGLPTDLEDMLAYLSFGYNQPLTELTIDEALAIALEHNHDLNSQRLSAAAACKGIDVEWAALRPQVALSAKSWWQDTNATTGSSGNPDGNDLYRQLALGLTQRIYDFGLSNDLIDIAEAQHAIKKYTVDMAEQQLVNDVIVSYYQFNLALGFARIRDDEHRLAQELLRQAEIQYRVGVVPRLDVIRAQSRVEEARANYISAQAQVGDAGARFFSLLGVEDQRYVPAVITAELVEIGPPPVDINSALGMAFANRPELELQYSAMLAGEAATRLTRNRPILNAYGNAMYQLPTGFAGSDNYEYGVQLVWNLYTGGKDEAAKDQAQLELSAISEDIIHLEGQIELDVTAAWNRAMAARSSADSARKTLELASEAHRAASIGYSAGVTPYIDYLDALDKNIAAALNYLFELAEVKMAQANLSRAMGFPLGYPGDSRGGMPDDATIQDVLGLNAE